MIPIILVTGFLGSGKTTFINWLLAKNPELKISVILNEFGNTQLESQFIKYHTENIVELANGCMCCLAKSDIPRVIRYILEHSPQTEYILIEASGLSDPDPVRESLQTPPVSNSTYLENTVCIIDTLNFENMSVQNQIIFSQVADADLIILSKLTEAGVEKVKAVESRLNGLTPDIRILKLTPDLPSEIFLTAAGPRASRPLTDHHHQIHSEYQTYWYETAYRLDFEKLCQFVSQLPETVIRVKGIAHCQSQKSEKFAIKIQRVGSHLMTEIHSQPTQLSTILFIGREIDSESIKEQVDNFRLEQAVTT